MTQDSRRFLIKTLGCKLNQYESQAIREALLRDGFSEITSGELPDLCIVNTCTVTAESDRKSRNLIGKLHRSFPHARLVVTGCYAELEEDRRRLSEIPGVSLVAPKSEFIVSSISKFDNHHRAFLKIQDGCDSTCSYCKVRLVRTKLESRPIDLIYEEAVGLAENGYPEIVLTGVELGAYGRERGEKDGLVKLIERIAGIPRLERIRLSSIELPDVTDGLIEVLSGEPKLCPHLHIPLQSGDDNILKAMKRSYGVKRYLGLADTLFEKIPSFALTTDVMVGFPGETEQQFQNTLSTLRELTPLKVHGFPYSDRAGTEAFNIRPKIPNRVKQNRVRRLVNEARDLSLKFRERAIGGRKKVLVEEQVGPALWQGHSEDYFFVRFEAEGDLAGKCVSVKITGNEAGFSVGRLAHTTFDNARTLCYHS